MNKTIPLVLMFLLPATILSNIGVNFSERPRDVLRDIICAEETAGSPVPAWAVNDYLTAWRLQVSALLEGTVRKAGNRLRITAQLVNAADGFEIWSERYDSEMKDVFDVQDEISRAMVGALSSELLGGSVEPIVRQSTENPEAYRLYLQGNRWFDLSEAGLRQNIEYLEQALAIDPGFPQARAALARMLSFLSTLGFERPADTLERARREALQALRSDETVAEAHVALAEILFYDDWDFVGAERSLRRAVQLNPANPDTRQSLGTLLASQGRFAEALEELRLALMPPRPSSLSIR